LLRNGLRDRITVQVDGQLKTGRDVIVAALLGAEEFGFATAPLVVSGCVMMRRLSPRHVPVGIATQNPELRKHFAGQPEFIETFFHYIAEECRELLAALGFRTMAEAVGRVDSLDTAAAIDHFWKAGKLDLRPILEPVVTSMSSALYRTRDQDHGLDAALDCELIEACDAAISEAGASSWSVPFAMSTVPSGPCSARWSRGATAARAFPMARSRSPLGARRAKASAPLCPAASL